MVGEGAFSLMKQFIIVRGLPGSGKSTFASMLAPPEHVCCFDEFLYIGSVYSFTQQRLVRAKRLTFGKFMGLVDGGVERIVFAGVSPDVVDVERFANAALAVGYVVTWLVVENRHGGKSVHGVPDETIDGMRVGFKIKL